jgi:predicted alpha/beta-fold hydrolase
MSLPSAIPYNEIETNPNTALLLTPGGGHMGFFSAFSTNKRFDHIMSIKFLKYELLERGKKIEIEKKE